MSKNTNNHLDRLSALLLVCLIAAELGPLAYSAYSQGKMI
jgi:hypothetical protein